MAKLYITGDSIEVPEIVSGGYDDCDDDRPTIPTDLAPKSEETYDDIGAFEMEKDFSTAFASVRASLQEEDPNPYDRPTVNYGFSTEDAA